MFGSLLGGVVGGGYYGSTLASARAMQNAQLSAFQMAGLQNAAPFGLPRQWRDHDPDPEGDRIRRTLRTILTTQIPEVKR